MPASPTDRSSSPPPPPADDYRLLVNSVEDYAIFMLDEEGRVASWNIGAEKIKGYAADEIIGEHFSKFYTPEDIALGLPARKLEIAKRVGRVEDEGYRVRKDGTLFRANIVITALRDERGTLRGFGKVTRDVTTRRETEQRLRQAEQRFHDLVDAVLDYAIYMLDSTGHVSTWNSGAARLKGYTAAEIIGQHFSIFYAPEDRAAGKPETVLQTVRRDGRFEEENFRIRKDGSRFWANVVITAVRDETGSVIGFAKVTRDLSARRAGEENARRLLQEQTRRSVAEESGRELRASEERYRALSRRLEIVLEGVADGITVQDRTGTVVFANSAAARLCGFSSVNELLNTPLSDVMNRFELLNEWDQPFDLENLPGRRVLAGEPSSSALLHVRERRTGRDFWSMIRAGAVLGSDGRPELAVNIWHDVSAERREERQSKYLADATVALGASIEYEEMLGTLAKVLVPGLTDWCSIHLLEGNELRHVVTVHANPEMTALATSYQQRFPPDPTTPTGVWNVLRTGKPELYEEISDELLARWTSDPEKLATLREVGLKSAILAPLRARGKLLGVLSLISTESNRHYDVSHLALAMELAERAGAALENARLYRAAQESAQAAERASRAKDEFLATVSHELRTPLNAIVGWASLLKARVTDPTFIKPVEIIHRNAEAQVKIIDDILDVSRVITGKFRLDAKPTDLVVVVREAIEVVRPSAVAKSIEIEFSTVKDFCLLVADPDRLQQVVWNLLSNALKFTGTGGKVSVNIGQEGSNVTLCVADTGAGIDPEFLPFVFDRFSQADPSITRRIGGLGLGLALVRHIVELHGGNVSASSNGRGTGATFRINLPVRAVSPHAIEAATASAPARGVSASLSGVNVLIVDDEPDARELLGVVLTNAGANVQTAQSAAEALVVLQRFRPDVLVSDIGMPDEDGFAFIQKVRRLPANEGGSVPAVALTAYTRDEDRARAKDAGYDLHIGKPVNPSTLAATVANLATRVRA